MQILRLVSGCSLPHFGHTTFGKTNFFLVLEAMLFVLLAFYPFGKKPKKTDAKINWLMLPFFGSKKLLYTWLVVVGVVALVIILAFLVDKV